jgi:hypothetical protein
MAVNVWIEPEYDDFGAPTGLYSVFGDEEVWRYGRGAVLVDAWVVAKSYDPNAVLKNPNPWRVRPLPFPELQKPRRRGKVRIRPHPLHRGIQAALLRMNGRTF